jgi:hypothetical protein
VTTGSGGSGVSLRSDDLDSVVELYTEDDFRQLVVAAEAMPTFLGGLCELEDHGESGLVRKTSPPHRFDPASAGGFPNHGVPAEGANGQFGRRVILFGVHQSG